MLVGSQVIERLAAGEYGEIMCCNKSLGLSSRRHRHVAIAITRQHVKEIAAHFAKDDKACERQLCTSSLLDIICSFQAGHELKTEIANYALDKAYPNKLQPWLLAMYELISDAW